ncbi:auxilin-like clathrin-binding protein required for normal clathrin function [Conoideocrella luteorostrata]|uniref:Auxilin-like clathrin-binding protein required for normal clathrin function n=1 Tax=Conoideocrella luteorostrata TaxID=1105319 RepID=A0AAJ0CUV3_9HYPO|nr:auxilin-like clathrin-binding protein required for normal clathrin function [Conoideocrella luteorostrata]
MDDLSGLDWSKPTGSHPKPLSGPMTMNPSYPSLRPTPSPAGSGRSTPASQGPAVHSSGKSAAKPTQDSFSNLVNFGGQAKAKQNLSLAERQAQLEAEKKKREAERRKQTEAQFGNAQQWDVLGSRAFTPSPSIPPPNVSNGAKNDDDELFAAFNKDTKVDNASHYPPPERILSTPAEEKKNLDLSNPNAWAPTTTNTNNNTNSGGFDDDDDPFGLSELKLGGQSSVPKAAAPADDDDFLGDLGKPIDEIRMRQQQQQRLEPGKPIEEDESSSSEDDSMPPRQPRHESGGNGSADKDLDRAVAQLVDYGFSPEDARRGLSQSGAGLNVQAAANWLLDDAHRKSKEKAQGRGSSAKPDRVNDQSERSAAGSSGRGGEPDLAKSAAAVGSSLFKTANSLWKTGQKKMQQAVADFQQDGGDQNQPKWMRETQQGRSRDTSHARSEATDEALALESGGRPNQTHTSNRSARDPRLGLQQSRTSSPVAPSSGSQSRNSPVPRWQQQAAVVGSDARSRLDRMKADDDDSFSGYVSANRRKKTTPTPTESPKPQEPEPDLLFNTEAPRPSKPISQLQTPRQSPSIIQQSRATPPPTSRKTTPKPPRQVPPISSAALQTSTKHRLEGTAHFKRGDYANAHSSYSRSLSAIPTTHPLMIVLLTNRALTALKTGEPKQAVTDSDEALKLIGAGNGQGESVSVAGEAGKEEARDMKELYGKALSRKAEALEQMEKWADAGVVWQQCVEAGVGGQTAVKGRQRCLNASAPKPKITPKPVAQKLRPKPSATAGLAPQKSSEAVTRLREANQAAAREDDEKFALSEKVDAKVSAWRDGKRDNLRGLIASMDQVLWENSGWKKVGMHELVMTNKVKISYMKAIAKTHPDKLPQDASTEVRLIAGLVFATLNESWDKFKAENGL